MSITKSIYHFFSFTKIYCGRDSSFTSRPFLRSFYRGLNLSGALFKSSCLFPTEDPPTEALPLGLPRPKPRTYQGRYLSGAPFKSFHLFPTEYPPTEALPLAVRAVCPLVRVPPRVLHQGLGLRVLNPYFFLISPHCFCIFSLVLSSSLSSFIYFFVFFYFSHGL